MTLADLTDAQIEALTDFAREDLATFARLAWPEINPGVELIWGPHNEAICLHLEAVTRGDIRRLLINVPPGSTNGPARSTRNSRHRPPPRLRRPSE